MPNTQQSLNRPTQTQLDVYDWARMFTGIPVEYTNTTYPLDGPTVTVQASSYIDSMYAANMAQTSPVATTAPSRGIEVATATEVVEPPTAIVPPDPPTPAAETLKTRYPDGRECYNKLHNCIVKYKGEWFLLTIPSYNYSYDKIKLMKLDQWSRGRDGVEINMNQVLMSDLDLESGNFGYMNAERGLLRVNYTRSRYYDAMHYGDMSLQSNQFGMTADIFRDKAFTNMLNNDYPSIQDAWAKVSARVLDKNISIAFHKNWAFNRSTLNIVTLHYKGEQVGELVLGNGTTYTAIQLYPSLDYLKRAARTDLGISLGVFDLTN